jgi:hypothetical protein
MGKLVPRVFFMIDAVQTGEKILVDDDITLPNSLEKGAETEQKVWDTFDKIYVNIASERVAEKKIRRIPIRKLRTAYAQEQMEFFTKDGEEYLIMGRWKDTQCGENLHAVKLPKGGSCLVNAENSLTLLEKEQLAEKLKNEKNIYLLGKNAADYTAIAENNCEIVDEFIFKYMYMCPQAETYFARFSRYYGRQDGKYDGLREICNIHGVELVE